MKIEVFTLKSSTAALLQTEILYSVATARASGSDLIRFDTELEKRESIFAAMLKILKAIKKQGKIDVYISASDITGESKEAEYLRNKYPLVSDDAEKEGSAFVKI